MSNTRSPLQRDAWSASFAVRQSRIDRVDDPLFHYTSSHVLEKIIQNRELWLTNAAYLNDEEELSYPASVARAALSEFMLKEPDLAAARFVQRTIRSLVGHVLFKSWFVGSLTPRHNQLSQWRAYCPGGGYAIGFTAAAIAHLVQQSVQLWLRKVIYQQAEQMERLRRLIAIHIDLWRTLRNQHSEMPQDEYDDELANTLGLALSEELIFFKRDVFAEEEEWRIARYRLESESVAFFERRGVLTPYVSFPLAAEDALLPLHAVIVGPLGDNALSEYSATLLLKHRGYDAAALIKSAGYKLRM